MPQWFIFAFTCCNKESPFIINIGCDDAASFRRTLMNAVAKVNSAQRWFECDDRTATVDLNTIDFDIRHDISCEVDPDEVIRRLLPDTCIDDIHLHCGPLLRVVSFYHGSVLTMEEQLDYLRPL